MLPVIPNFRLVKYAILTASSHNFCFGIGSAGYCRSCFILKLVLSKIAAPTSETYDCGATLLLQHNNAMSLPGKSLSMAMIVIHRSIVLFDSTSSKAGPVSSEH